MFNPGLTLQIRESCNYYSESMASTDIYPCDISWYLNFENTVLSSNESVRVYALEENKTGFAVAIMPCTLIYEHRGLIGIKVLRSMSNYYSPAFEPLLHQEGYNDLVSQLLDRIITSEKPDKIELQPLLTDSVVYNQIVREIETSKWIYTARTCSTNWYQNVDFTFDEYFAKRPSKLKNTYARKLAKFNSCSDSKLVIINSQEKIDKYIADYLEVYGNSWKEPEPHVEFIPGLIRLCAARGELRLGIAYIEGVPIAAQIWVVVNSVAYIYKLAYDEAYKTFSPGTLLTVCLMKCVIDTDNVEKVDFLTGDDNYKRDWMSEKREFVELMAFNTRTVAGWLGIVKSIWLSSLKEYLKK